MDEQPDERAAKLGREQSINERAYAIWHEQGQPEGKDQKHWLRAEQEYDDYCGSATAPDPMPAAEGSTKR